MYHSPTPPSYWSIDVDDPYNSDNPQRPGLMAAHVVFMSLAFFVALPAGIALRSVRHSFHGVALVGFYGLCILGCACSALYAKSTPNMYEGAVHSKQGYVIIFGSLFLSAIDASQLLLRAYRHIRSGGTLQPRVIWRRVVRGVDLEHEPKTLNREYHTLMSEERQLSGNSDSGFASPDWNEEQHTDSQNEVCHHQRRYSHTSEGTVVFFTPAGTSSEGSVEPNAPLWARVGGTAFAIAERALVFAGFVMLTTGIVTYTGGCRENYLNGCLAHLIKSGLFLCYGLITFARFLGAFADFGWSWNRLAHGRRRWWNS